MKTAGLVAALCSSLLLTAQGSGESLEFTLQTDLYTSLQQVPCTRLMTAQRGSIGCGSLVEGSGGVFYLLESESDYQAFFDTDESLDTVIVAQPEFFTADRVNAMRKHGSVQGAILLPSSSSSGYSPASRQELSLMAGQGGDLTADDSGVQYTNTAWNHVGSGLAQQYFGTTPMSAVSGQQAATILQQAQENKKRGAGKYPAYAARFWTPMGPGDLNSVDCLIEGTCDFMGGQSVWASSTPLWKNFTAEQTVPAKQQYVMATTTGDAFAHFHQRAFGADAAVSGTVAIVAAAAALGQGHLQGHWNLTELQYGMLWGVFQGEHVGRLGSRQWVNDIQNFRCQPSARRWGDDSPSGKPLCTNPVRTDLAFQAINQTSDVVHLLAVQQVGTPRTPDQTQAPFSAPHMGLYQAGLAASSNERSANAQYLQQVLQLVAAANGTGFSIANTSSSPPSPADAVRSTSPHVNAAVLMRANGTRYNNVFYGSELDDANNIDVDAVIEAATFVARGMFALASGESLPADAAAAVPPGLAVDSQLVRDLVNCFTVNAQCDLFAGAVNRPKSSLPEGPLSLFTGLFARPSVGSKRISVPTSLAEAVIKNMLGNATVTEVNGTCSSSNQCQDATGSTRFECLFGQCVVTNSFLHSAKSLGISDSLRIFASRANELDPMFTEPLWSEGISAQLYVADNPASGIAMLVVGLLLTLASCFGMRRFSSWVTQHYKVL